jgi:hypothetical protein
MLSDPIHAEGIVISGLHFLLFVNVRSLGINHLLSEDFSTCLTVRAICGLHDVEVRKAGDRWLLLDDVGLLGVWIIDWLRLGDVARLLVDDGWDLEMECQHFLQMEYMLAK